MHLVGSVNLCQRTLHIGEPSNPAPGSYNHVSVTSCPFPHGMRGRGRGRQRRVLVARVSCRNSQCRAAVPGRGTGPGGPQWQFIVSCHIRRRRAVRRKPYIRCVTGRRRGPAISQRLPCRSAEPGRRSRGQLTRGSRCRSQEGPPHRLPTWHARRRRRPREVLLSADLRVARGLLPREAN